MSIDLEKAVEAFQLAEMAHNDRMAASGLLFDPALGVEAGLIAALPYLREESPVAEDVNRLKLFAHAIFEATDWPDGGDLDGFEFQGIAERHGLLAEETRSEPCGEICQCREMGADFPAQCFRKTPLYYACATAADSSKDCAAS